MMWSTPDTQIWDDPYTNWEFWQTFKFLSIGWLPAVNQESGLSDVTLETPWDLPSELQSSKSSTPLASTKV